MKLLFFFSLQIFLLLAHSPPFKTSLTHDPNFNNVETIYEDLLHKYSSNPTELLQIQENLGLGYDPSSSSSSDDGGDITPPVTPPVTPPITPPGTSSSSSDGGLPPISPPITPPVTPPVSSSSDGDGGFPPITPPATSPSSDPFPPLDPIVPPSSSSDSDNGGGDDDSSSSPNPLPPVPPMPIPSSSDDLTPGGPSSSDSGDFQSSCEVCTYVVQNKEQSQPYLCRGLRDSNQQRACVDVLESMMWYVTNEVYWTNYGCPRSGGGWVRPCPAHVVCSWMEHLSTRLPFCPPDAQFPRPTVN